MVAFGPRDDIGQTHMKINDYRFFSRVVLGGDIGLGEAFMFDEWDTDDLPALLGFFFRNRQFFEEGEFKQGLLLRMVEKLRYLSRANSLVGSRRNIRQHYDLSNAFFQTFLDPSMAYSSAIFKHSGEPLAVAQQNKYGTLIDKLRLSSGDHLLEIGCGWGGFAIEAVRRTGCRITGITISKDQYTLARERVRQAGLQDRIRIQFRDYRKMGGRYDKIVSIEMLEAVGHAYYGTFFRQLDRLLAPHGIAVIQTITIPDQRYDLYRKTHDWIQKHIFPGGLLPSLTIITQTMTRHSSLMIDDVENIGNHYATTLARWHRRFIANLDRVAQLGFDREFQRKWAYYLGSCEAGFRERALGNLQLVLTREGNHRLADRDRPQS
jgi:cyclopropane-fatty-acyl-phospholipid synthase